MSLRWVVLGLGVALLALSAALLWLIVITRRQRAALAHTRATLDTHVRERTAALEAANQSLALAVDTHRRTQAELQRSNRDLSQFAHLASHDLREPLRMIASYTELLGRRYADALDDRARRYIQYASQGAHRMRDLLDDLLAYAQVGLGGPPLAAVDARKLFADVIADLDLAIRDAAAEIEIGDISSMYGNRTLLKQLFQNLIANAIKFRSERQPKIQVQVTVDGASQVFCVADNGIGIAAEHHDRVFAIFQRLHDRERYSGTGIGLALAKRIAEYHSGRIWLESVEGEGTSFYVSLPAHDAADASPPS